MSFLKDLSAKDKRDREVAHNQRVERDTKLSKLIEEQRQRKDRGLP